MKIKFRPLDEKLEGIIDPPKPASQFLPEWYKNMPQFLPFTGDSTHGLSPYNNQSTNTTLKHCPPFLDSLTTGYIYSLPADIEVRIGIDGYLSFKWRTDGDFVIAHTEEQHPGLPSVVDGDSSVMKWGFDFRITTPPGYSTMFTHPFNRHDLPFRTFTGVVETDSYPQAVQFPFQFLSSQITEENLIIKRGTPLVQIIPFKRESWTSEVEKPDYKKAFKDSFMFNSTIVKSYKNNFWKKKTYK